MIMCSFKDHNNNLWIGTQSGVLFGNERDSVFRQFDQNIHNPYSLSDRVILCIYEDKNNIIWIGTYNGLNKYINEAQKLKNYKIGLSDQTKNLHVVRSIFTTDDQQFFIGTINSLCLYNSQNESIEFIRNRQEKNLQNVFCIVKDIQ